MMTTVKQIDISEAYNDLSWATVRAYEFGEAALRVKADLDEALGAALLDGRIEGKNEAQREAQARRVLADRFAAVESTEADARAARRDLELARLRVESLRMQVRLAEVLTHAQTAAE